MVNQWRAMLRPGFAIALCAPASLQDPAFRPDRLELPRYQTQHGEWPVCHRGVTIAAAADAGFPRGLLAIQRECSPARHLTLVERRAVTQYPCLRWQAEPVAYAASVSATLPGTWCP